MNNFSIDTIKKIPTEICGAYLQLFISKNETLSGYIGRSNCIRRRQLEHWYSGVRATELHLFPTKNIDQAFVKECELYHSLSRNLFTNDIHPASINGSKCPWCKLNKKFEE